MPLVGSQSPSLLCAGPATLLPLLASYVFVLCSLICRLDLAQSRLLTAFGRFWAQGGRLASLD